MEISFRYVCAISSSFFSLITVPLEIYTLINHLVEQGKTVLMISSEMEELMGMSDRILILAEGNMTGELNKSEFNQERIMQLASIEKGE